MRSRLSRVDSLRQKTLARIQSVDVKAPMSARVSLADAPDTVQFDLDFDGLPTSSLESAELELVAPACPQEAPASEADVPSAAQPHGNMPSSQPAREIGPGTLLHNRYLIENPLGVGGSSTVFSAVDRHRSEGSGACGRVAVKVLHCRFREDKARVFRLIREFRHMQRLTHAGIARVFDLDCDAGAWFITMELLEGQSLHRRLKDGLQEGEALRILTQCTEALAYAHQQGVMHGDLKPGNIFITHEGSVRLLDFGSVPDRDEAAATDCSPLNLAATLAYASPEMLEKKGIEPRDDLFSLGCVAYELFSGGQHPFDRKSSLEARRQNLQPAGTRAIQAQQFAVIAQMLAWERAARPASAREFLQAFLAAVFRTEAANATTAPSLSGAALKSASAGDSVRADADAATPSDGAPTVPEPGANIGPDVHLNAGAETHPASAGSDSGSDESVRADAIPASPAPDPTKVDPEALNRTGPNAAARGKIDSATPSAWSPSAWSLRAALIALLVLVLIAAVFLSRWQPETSTPVATVPAPAATTEQAATVAPPAAIVLASPEPPPPTTKPPIKVSGPTAAAAPPSLASFQSALIQVGSSQQLAVVNVVREKSTAGSARVAWAIVGNTAKAGIDYDVPDSPVMRFNDGQRVRSLYIPIKHPAAGGTPRTERRFTVKLQKAPDGLPPGRIARAEVVISAP